MDALKLDEDVYAHLRALAGVIHNERAGRKETIHPTALLHEAWEKVAGHRYESRSHFMAVAARAMRQILVDRARARGTSKRGGGDLERTTLSGIGDGESQPLDVIALDDALKKLEAADSDAARIAVMYTFGGMTAPEISEAMGISVRSVWRSWRFTRAFLARLMKDDPGIPQG